MIRSLAKKWRKNGEMESLFGEMESLFGEMESLFGEEMAKKMAK